MLPLVEDAAMVETSALKVKALSRQMACLNEDIDQYECRIAQLFAAHPEHDLFDTLPGAGPALAPRLLVAIGSYQPANGMTGNGAMARPISTMPLTP